MILLLIGAVFVALGSISISFPELCESLKRNDEQQWRKLGSPSGLSFRDLTRCIGVYSWVLKLGYKNSSSEDVKRLGAQAFRKARLTRYAIISSSFIAIIGFWITLSRL